MTPPTARNHAIDAARAILMLLGIPFHAANVYRVDHVWFVSSPVRSEAVTAVAHFIHLFRMEAFFLVAGYFSLLLVGRSGARAWLSSRAVRLGVPLVTGVLVVNTLQELVSELVLAPAPALGAAAVTVLHRFARPGPHWVRHLWFLPDLLLFSAVFALAWQHRRARLVAAACRAATRLLSARPAVVVPAALALGGVYKLALLLASEALAARAGFYGVQHAHKLLGFAPFFALGVLLASREGALARFARPSRLGAAAAALSCAIALALEHHGGRAAELAGALVAPAAAGLATHALLAAANRWLARPSRAVRHLVDASFTVYLVHLPILALLGLAAVRLRIPPVPGFVLVVAATTVASVLVHRLVAAHPVALFLWNGVPPRPRAEPAPRLARAA